jgi:predicted HTH domain antitoxin
MSTLTISVPEDLAEALGYQGEDAGKSIQTDLILSAYAQGRVSGGKAAELLGLKRMEFEKLIGERGICRPYDIAELERDIAWAKKQA